MSEEMEFPQPTVEHNRLKEGAGVWKVESTFYMDPNPEVPPMVSQAKETIEMFGEFWACSVYESDFMGQPFRGKSMLGYDPEKKSFVGTWIDSVTPFLWTFTGQLDDEKKVLLLETEGPRWGVMGTSAKYRERHEFVDADHRTTASSIQNDDGSWFTFLRTDCRRTK